jgi:hypothetical protein
MMKLSSTHYGKVSIERECVFNVWKVAAFIHGVVNFVANKIEAGEKWIFPTRVRLTMRASGLGGTRRARTAVSAKAFFRFIGWSSHQRVPRRRHAGQAASHWALQPQVMYTEGVNGLE